MAKKVKTSVTFETQGDRSFTCIVDYDFKGYGLIGYGKTAREAEAAVWEINVRQEYEQQTYLLRLKRCAPLMEELMLLI